MGPLLLIVTTLIWGTAFLAQKVGADSIGPFALTAYRNLLGGLFLAGCIVVRNRWLARPSTAMRRSVWAGAACGLPLFAAMVAQQIGIEYTTPGISAFLTTNYVLFVPLMAALAYRRLPGWHIFLGVALALPGTYFLCMSGESMSVGRGEAWTLLCALLFSVQMLFVDRLAPRCDVLVMSAAQLFTGFVIGLPLIFLPSESIYLHHLVLPSAKSLWPLFYCGIMSSGIAYTLQNFGQAKTSASLAAILLSLESVFGALSGYIFRGDVMTPRQFIGCGLVFAAVIAVQMLSLRSVSQESHRAE